MPTTDRAAAGPAHAGLTATAQLDGCRDAEDYFRLLGVDYDPTVLAVNRLHILRAFGQELARLTAADGSPTEDPDTAVREALRRSYAAFTSTTALDHRLFRVLREHAPRNVIRLDAVLPESPGEGR